MGNKKHIYSKDEDLKKEIHFCTECGEDLSQFGISGKIDKKQIEERHKKCKQTGKYKGDMCAMIFIASDSELLPPAEEFD